MSKPYCRYCKRDIRLYHFGDAEYPYQKNYGPIWKCVPCDAYVGCHKGTERPLGLVADAATRAAKIKKENAKRRDIEIGRSWCRIPLAC